MKKLISTLSVVLALALLLSACGLPGSAPVSAPAETVVPAETAGQEPTPPPRDMGPVPTPPPEPFAPTEIERLPEAQWQGAAGFPDWKGYVDDTLALNSMFSFETRRGQGRLYLHTPEKLESMRLFVNGREADCGSLKGGKYYVLDLSPVALNGRSTLQVTGIQPRDLEEPVQVWVDYPAVLPGNPEEEGIAPESLALIDGLIASDVAAGFPGAQLAVLRHGRLVYQRAWGSVNAWLPDGSRNENAVPATTETMYDLASVTKMFSVNYSLQKLVTEGTVDLDRPVTDYLGSRFVDELIDLRYEGMEELTPQTQYQWKSSMTLRHLLCHQSGFPSSPRYDNLWFDAETQSYRADGYNLLYAGCDGSEATRAATLTAICKTPLMFAPGSRTQYSDVNYMLLGFILEQITGQDLDSYLKETFFRPLGLERITYTPLEHGFSPEDCAATELRGNTRCGLVWYPGVRETTLQGQVHDEMAWACMGGVSGHAGLFSDASDLAKLAFVMLTGGYGEHRFFSRSVIDSFTAPRSADAGNWGLGWWREGENQRAWYFGTQSAPDTIGHQGWTGTMVMIDPERDLIVAYLTNKLNSPVTSPNDPDRFDGNWFTASTLGFVPQILSIGMDRGEDPSSQLLALLADMVSESMKLVPEGALKDPGHPAARNVESKLALLESRAESSGDPEIIAAAQALRQAWEDAVNGS